MDGDILNIVTWSAYTIYSLAATGMNIALATLFTGLVIKIDFIKQVCMFTGVKVFHPLFTILEEAVPGDYLA